MSAGSCNVSSMDPVPSVFLDDHRFAEHLFDQHRGVLTHGVTITGTRDLVHQLLPDTAANLTDAAGRNRHDDACDLADQIAGADLRARLLPIQEASEHPDGAAEHKTGGRPGDGR